MPHVDIKSFPREFTDEEKQTLADEITEVIVRRFASKTESVSVSLQHVTPDAWRETVYEPEIMAQEEYLIKKPGYSM